MTSALIPGALAGSFLWAGLWGLACLLHPDGAFFPFGSVGWGIAGIVSAGWVLLGVGIALFYVPPGDPSAGRDRRYGVEFVVLAALLWGVFGRGFPLDRLYFIFFFPQFSVVHEFFQRGLMPLWNPWANAGMSLTADPQMGIFYPLNAPLFLWGPLGGLLPWLALHGALLAVFTRLWLRGRGASSDGVNAGTVIVLLCGYTTLRATYVSHFASL
ncbi:MAG: hypothetical protein L0Z48_11795, partial [candidate division Zixibacteria bacterium]|nr:hypothetical protein [candidate division Zixibacteria bacterium]